MIARSEIVVITGGTAGIGRATVREFAAAGYDVVVPAGTWSPADPPCTAATVRQETSSPPCAVRPTAPPVTSRPLGRR